MTQPPPATTSPSALSLVSTSGRKWLLLPVHTLSPAIRLVRDVTLPTPHVPTPLILKSLTLPSAAALQQTLSDAASWARACSADPVHVLRLHDVFITADNSLALLMQHCPGGDLTAGLRSEPAALRVLAAVAAAVETVVTAAAQPAHANIAPSHVLIDANGLPRLAGWGYSRARRLANKKRKLTQRDDVKALAALLYEMIYGRRWDPELAEWPTEPNITDATRSLIANILTAKSSDIPELTVFRYDIAAARNLVPRCTAALAPVQNNRRREQFLGADLDSIRGLHATTEPDDPPEEPATEDNNDPTAADFSDDPPPQPHLVAANGTRSAPKPMKVPPASIPMEQLNDATVVDIVKRITSADAVPFNSDDLDLLVNACTQSPEMSEKIFKVLFTLKISKNPVVAFKAIMLIHQLLAEGPAKLTALAITHDGFLSWAESEWSRERIPNKVGKPHMLSYCFGAGEIAWYMAVIRKRIVVHAKFAQVFSTHWIPRPDGLPSLQTTLREAFRSILEIVEKCNVLLRKMLAAKDPMAILKHSAVPTLASELAKAYLAMCYIYATADDQKKIELDSELAIAHKSTKTALDAVRANLDIAAACPSPALLVLQDEPPESFDVQEIASALRKKRKKRKKKTPAVKQESERKVSSREPSPEPNGAEQDSSDDVTKERRSPDPDEAEEGIPVVDSITEKFKKRRNGVQKVTSAVPTQQPVSNGIAPDIGRREKGLHAARPPVAPVIGMEKLSLSIRKGATRNVDAAESMPAPKPVTRDPPTRPLPRGRPNFPADESRNTATKSRRYRQISDESSDSESEDSESPAPKRPVNGRGHAQNATDVPSQRRKVKASKRVEDTESDSGSNEDRTPQGTRRAKKSKAKQAKEHGTDSGSATSDDDESDGGKEKRSRKRSPNKMKGEQSHPRRRSPTRHVDEKKIPFDKEPPTKKKSAAKKKPASQDGAENGYRGGSTEALAAAASGKKTPNMNPKFEVAPYEVQFGPQIGSGGFGVVYKARFRDETVAVKKIHAHALSNASSVAEFQAEVAVLCTLRHPNILRFVGACTKPPNLMIITEFMARGTLFDVLHQSQMRVTWPMRKKIALDTCKGMRYLHDSKLLHRDLKSSNLMLDKDFNCKVGDFGLTRISRGSAATQMTGQCGTFQYMAVEVLANKPYSEKADVFSFGILLWEMVARKLPYFGMQPMQVGIAVLQQGMRPPIPPKCPAPLAKLMQACWDSDPNRRPSFHQLVHALEAMPE